MDDRKELDMQSIFDEKWNRTGTGTIKWKASEEGRKDIIPMGIADMEFATAPCVIEAVRRRMEHPLFGYFNLDNRFYEAIMNWHGRHFHNEDLRPEHILYQNGVLGESQQPFRHLLFRETGYCAADLFIQDSSVPLGIWGGCSAPVC